MANWVEYGDSSGRPTGFATSSWKEEMMSLIAEFEEDTKEPTSRRGRQSWKKSTNAIIETVEEEEEDEDESTAPKRNGKQVLLCTEDDDDDE